MATLIGGQKVTDCLCDPGLYMQCEGQAAASCEADPAKMADASKFSCVSCPTGSVCTGDSNAIQTETGFWKAPEAPGSISASVDLVGVPASNPRKTGNLTAPPLYL